MMHVAICDDNVADRKQSERLLHRESDRRLAAGGNFYIDSYGTAESLLANPMRYEVYFIDICQGTLTASDILEALSRQGISTPVVFCCSAIDYRTLPIRTEEKNRVIFIDKPLKAAELSAILDRAQQLSDNAMPFIELRVENQTFYVKEEDILYCREKGRHVIVTLLSGKTITVCTSALNLFAQWEETFDTFLMPSPKTILNGRHVEKTGFRKVSMKDGRTFSVPGTVMRYIKKYIQQP